MKDKICLAIIHFMIITILSLAYSILIGVLCSRYAVQRGRGPQTWFYIGLFFGLTGLITLFLLPRAKPAPVAQPQDMAPIGSQPPDPRFQNWFFVDQKQERQGPVPFRRLFTAWRDQLISSDSLVWTEGMAEWEPICKLPSLLDKLN
jgi:hypothetical protein